jgi:anti-sigma B factor antagonist
MSMLENPVDHVDGTAVVTLRGEVDIATVGQLRQTLMGLLDTGHNRIVLDLAHLYFIDSTGIGVLIGAHRRAAEAGGELVLRRVSPRTRDVLRMVALDRVLTIES